MCSLTLSVGWAQRESRDIWFTWRNSLLLFLPVQQHDLILWLQLRRHIFLPMGDSLHGMELKAAGFKVQTQTIRVSADKELDRFRFSVSICHAQMSRWKGSGLRLPWALKSQISSQGSLTPPFLVWNGLKHWLKVACLGTWFVQVTFLIYFTEETIESISMVTLL